jgi:hypothetical protein
MRNEPKTIAVSTVLPGVFSVAVIVACFSIQSWCADRKGTYDATYSAHIFDLSAPRGSLRKNELILRLEWGPSLWPPAWVSTDRHEVIAKKCSSNPGDCENAISGTIQFDEIGKHISGSFDVEFANGREQGKFKVKYRHNGPRIICE